MTLRIIKKHIWLILSQFIIVFTAIINIFPQNLVFARSDTYQFFFWPKIISQLSYTWQNAGEGVFYSLFAYKPFYLVIFFFSSLFRLAPNAQTGLYFLLFLLSSFWSFYFSIYVFSSKKTNENNMTLLFSLLYSFNVYTLYDLHLFPTSPFLFLYVLVPSILALTYKFFSKEKFQLKTLSLLVICFALTNISNGNLPFFISLNLLIVLMVGILILIDLKTLKIKQLFIKLSAYYSVFFLAVAWSVLPQINEMFRTVNIFKSSSAIWDIRSWIIWQAVKFPNPFFLTNDISAFEEKFSFFALGGLVLFIIFVLAYIYKKSSDNKKIIVFLILLLFTIFLFNKGNGIMNKNQILAIFHGPILESLRSYDKTLIFLPFLILILIYFCILELKKFKPIIYTLLILSLASTYPIFEGTLNGTHPQNYKDEDGSNSSSSLVKIPSSYLETASKLNLDKNDAKIIYSPYAVINSIGWANYPKWNLVGNDPTVQIFNKPIVQMNSFSSFGKWNYGQYWNEENPQKSDWLLPFAGLLNANYLMYHKDVGQEFIEQTAEKIKYYENNDDIVKVDDNAYFTLYKINPKFTLPHFYTTDNIINSSDKVEDLPFLLSQKNYQTNSVIYLKDQNNKNLNELKSSNEKLPEIEYKKINPTKYRIVIHQAKGNFPLVMSESFNEGWKLYQSQDNPKSKNKTELETQVNSSYKIIANNDSDQATSEDLKSFIDQGWISSLGDNKEKELTQISWSDNDVDSKTVIDHYKIDFISKDNKGTIQNDNLSDGNITETWFQKPIENNQNHLVANGYANSWAINPKKLCSDSNKCVKNADGSYDMEFIVEFWPQRLYYLGGIISGSVLLFSLSFLCSYFVFNRKKLSKTI